MRAAVSAAGWPGITASTCSSSTPYSRAQARQERSTAASESTRVPSMSNSTAAYASTVGRSSVRVMPRPLLRPAFVLFLANRA